MAVRKKRTPWTADQWVAEWTTNPDFARPAKSTNESNAERVSKFATDFKGVRLVDITPQQAKEWAEQNAPRAAVVRAMLNDAKEHGVIPYNPLAGVSSRKPEKPRPRLTEQEVEDLAAVAYDMFPDWPVMGALITTAAYTGMGLGELSALEWKNVDFKNGTILVERQFKPRQREFTGARYDKRREIAMPSQVAEALQGVPRLGPDGLVFYSPRAHGVYYSQLNSHFWPQVRAAFFERLPRSRRDEIGRSLDFADLRYFTAEFLYRSGVETADAAVMLGVTTKRLVEMFDPARDGAVTRVREAFLRRAV